MNQETAKSARLWREYWYCLEVPYSLTLFRIAFGFYLFCYFSRFFLRVPQIFSNEAINVPLLEKTGAPGPSAAWAIYFLTLGVIVLFSVGYKLKFTTPILLGLYLYYFNLTFGVVDCSFDRLIVIFLAVLTFSGAGISIKELLASGVTPPKLVSTWGVKLIQLQLSLLYFEAGLAKLVTPIWLSGRALELTFQSGYTTDLGRWFYSVWPSSLYGVLTVPVIIFEISMSVALYSSKTRYWAIGLGTAFHLANSVLIDVPEFLICPVAYILFLTSTDIRRLGAITCRWSKAVRT